MYRVSKLLAAVSIGVLALSVAPPATAEVLIAPTRVVLERGERSAELIVVNKGDEEAAFRVSIENRRMLMDGSMEAAESTEPGEQFAKDLIRYAPRRVVLEPGGRQTIRVSASLSGDLEPGEYRSHLRLMSAPLSAGRSLESATNTEVDGLSIQLIAIRSLTIPVILRVGDLEADVSIDTLDVRDGDSENEMLLVARLSRDGGRSAYGDIKIFVDDEPEPVYFARGIAIYTPNAERDVILPLPTAIHERLTGKNVRIAYVSSNPQAPGVIAEYSTRLP
ncbi:MAG: hypothetical protein AAGK23_02595 [Pseudomonadota bacterium]